MVVSVQSTLCLLVYCKQNARQFWEYSLTRAPSWGWNFGRPNLPTDAYCILMMISWNIIIHQNNTNWGVHKIYCSLRSSLMLHIQLKQTVQNSPSQLSARTTCMFLWLWLLGWDATIRNIIQWIMMIVMLWSRNPWNTSLQVTVNEW